jgi:hypothetical protein
VIMTAPLALALSGCWFGKKAVAVAPAPRAPQPVAANPALLPPPAPAKEEELPAIEPAPPPSPDALKTEPPADTLATPPKKKPPPKKRPTPGPAAPEVPAVAPPQTTPPAKLGEVLTDDRRRQYETDLTRTVAQARAALNQTAGRILTAAQRQTVERIQTFLQQADQARSGDLATAVQLAHRADLLAQDLRKSLQ